MTIGNISCEGLWVLLVAWPPHVGLFRFRASNCLLQKAQRPKSSRRATPPYHFRQLGSGKSSLLKAGILPRLERDTRNFIVCTTSTLLNGSLPFQYESMRDGTLSPLEIAIRDAAKKGREGLGLPAMGMRRLRHGHDRDGNAAVNIARLESEALGFP
jgi:hypothetical protein